MSSMYRRSSMVCCFVHFVVMFLSVSLNGVLGQLLPNATRRDFTPNTEQGKCMGTYKLNHESGIDEQFKTNDGSGTCTTDSARRGTCEVSCEPSKWGFGGASRSLSHKPHDLGSLTSMSCNLEQSAGWLWTGFACDAAGGFCSKGYCVEDKFCLSGYCSGGGNAQIGDLSYSCCSKNNKMCTARYCETLPTSSPSYKYAYVAGSWASCSECTQKRQVVCKRSDSMDVPDSYCSGSKPSTSQSCNTQACAPSTSYSYSYSTGSWGSCSASCGGGTQTRSVTCKRSDGQSVSDSYCSGTKPSTSGTCNSWACTTFTTVPKVAYTYAFSEGSFGSCSESCGGGTRTRTVTCLRSDGQAVADTMCSGTKPSTSDSCNNQSCNTTSSASKLAQVFYVIAFLALAVAID